MFILLTACLFGCVPENKHRWLTTFFDGVPPLGGATNTTSGVTAPATPTTTKPASPSATVASTKPSSIQHSPYSQRKCDACHESKFSHKLRAPAVDLCLSCHKKFLTPLKFVHAPVASGFCLGCHDPHQSNEKFLLVQAGQPLCRACHDAQDVDSIRAHAKIGTTACQQCHEPHSSDRKDFLKPNVPIPPS